MKVSKTFISIAIVVLTTVAWISLIGKNVNSYKEYKELVMAAESSLEDGLYEQSIELYKQTLSYRDTVKTYQKIKEIYDLYYEEEHTPFVRNCYITDMQAASAAYPKNAEFWLMQVKLYLDAENDSKAYNAAKMALNNNVENEELSVLYQQLLYQVKLEYKLYSDFKTCLNGYITVYDGSQWMVLDGTGEQYSSKYQFIGLINDEGRGIYTNDIDTRLLDKNEVTRARYDIDVEDAGYFTESSGYVPVKIDGVWKYLNEKGEYLPGEFDEAGSFYNHKAAVKQGEEWFLIDDTGAVASEKYEDVKLDLYGSYIQGDVILAKTDGKYHIFNTDWEQVGDFACEDIDICIDNGLIAFKQGEKWGYVDIEGNVVVEPQFAEAKSFANKMAAVCDAKGYWGFINSRYELVIDYAYQDAHYFNSDERCIVSASEGSYQILRFVFE